MKLRSNARQAISGDDQNRGSFYELPGQGVSRSGHSVHGFCWMGKHVNLAIQVGEALLSRIMQQVGFRDTQSINCRYGQDISSPSAADTRPEQRILKDAELERTARQHSLGRRLKSREHKAYAGRVRGLCMVFLDAPPIKALKADKESEWPIRAARRGVG